MCPCGPSGSAMACYAFDPVSTPGPDDSHVLLKKGKEEEGREKVFFVFICDFRKKGGFLFLG